MRKETSTPVIVCNCSFAIYIVMCLTLLCKVKSNSISNKAVHNSHLRFPIFLLSTQAYRDRQPEKSLMPKGAASSLCTLKRYIIKSGASIRFLQMSKRASQMGDG